MPTTWADDFSFLWFRIGNWERVRVERGEDVWREELARDVASKAGWVAKEEARLKAAREG